MKRIGKLFEKIVDTDNIKLAIINASKGKKQRKIVEKVLENLEAATQYIKNLLINELYVPSPYIIKKIKDGKRQKERIIHKPCFFPDQCIHWAIIQIIEDVIQRGQYEYCCASVKNRGVHYAKRYIEKILVRDRKNTKYCLQLDIKKFYQSIDKNILKNKFRYVIKDRETLILLDTIVDSCDDEGVPIRKLYFTAFCKLLFTRIGSLY